MADFGSADAAHEGYIFGDDIIRAVYLNGLDQSYFALRLDGVYAGTAPGAARLTSSKLMHDFQSYALEKGQPTPTNTAFTSKALVSDADALVALTKLGPLKPGYCPLCWAKGFSNKFNGKCGYTGVAGTCGYANRSLYAKKSSTSVAAVADTKSLSDTKSDAKSLADARALVAAADVAVASADVKSVADYEEIYRGYVAACGRLQVSKPKFLVATVDSADIPDIMALVSSVISPKWWWDCAASISLVCDLSWLTDVVTLNQPFSVGGVKDGVLVTHSGYVKFLPRQYGLAYYSDSLACNLLSLGYFQEQGGSDCTLGPDKRLIKDAEGATIDVAQRLTNRLYAVSPSLLRQVVLPLVPLVAMPAVVPSADHHLTARQRLRCDAAELLHSTAAAHLNDDDLADAVTNGAYPVFNVTAADIRMNRLYRGACPQCLEGKLDMNAMKSSESQPPATPGAKIYGDVHATNVTSVGGNTVSIRTICGYTGDIQDTGAISKSGQHLFEAIMELVYLRYNAYGHKVIHLVFDADPSLKPVPAMLAPFNILMTFVSPGQFCQRMENVVQTQDNRKRAVAATLPFVIPPKYDAYARRWVADTQNDQPNSLSRPSCAQVLVTGERRVLHYKFPMLSFGSCCMVKQFDDKRTRLMKKLGMVMKDIPKAEFAVCMGYSRETPGSFDFLLANGQIVPRKVIEIVQVHPWDWLRKSVLRSELKLPQVEPLFSGRQPSVQGSSSNLSPVTSDISELDQLPRDYYVPPVALEPVIDDSPASEVPSDVFSPSTLSIPYSPEEVLPPITSDEYVPVLPALQDSAPSPPVVPRVRLPVAPVSPMQLRSSSRANAHAPGFWSGSTRRALAADSDGWQLVPPRRQPPIVSASAVSPMLPMLPLDFMLSMISSAASSPFLTAIPPAVPVVIDAIDDVPDLIDDADSDDDDDDDDIDDESVAASVAPIVIIPSSVHRRHDVSRDPLTLLEREIIAAFMAQDLQDAISVETSSFSTMQDDEFDLDSAAAYFAGVSGPDCFVAARVRSSDLQPEHVTHGCEISLRAALGQYDYAKLLQSSDAEVAKQTRLGCIGAELYSEADLPFGCAVVNAHTLFKEKLADNRFTCRIAGQGQRLAPDMSLVESTYTTSASDGDKFYTLAVMQAYCASRGEHLNMSDFDVVGGFLRIKRTSAIRLFLRFPSNFPNPSYAGRLVEVFGALYGLKESNRLFSDEVDRVVRSAGYKPSSVSPQTYILTDPLDSAKKSIVSVHVDDFRALDNAPELTAKLHAALVHRFTEITYNPVSKSFTGVEIDQSPAGPILCTQRKFISKVARSVGVSHLPSVDIPCDADFFAPSVTTEDLLPVSVAAYTSLTGSLIHVLQTRDDVRTFVSYLCSKNALPDEGHYSKALHLLRYLSSTPHIGRCFSSVSTDIVAYSDSAFMLHRDLGKSSGAFFFSVGAANAPFYSEAKIQDIVATCPMTSEYYAAGAACKYVIHIRQLSSDLGFAPSGPTVLLLDSQTAINLAIAPQISRKSRHIEMCYHYVRELVARNLVTVSHVIGDFMRADVMTKYLPRGKFLTGRSNLLNSAAFPAVSESHCASSKST